MSNTLDSMLSIQQVSVRTGLTKPVIRKWEDRYKTVEPKRLENGRRVYSERDVQILQAVRNLVDEGMSIQQATTYALENVPEPIAQHTSSPISDYCFRLLEEGTNCNVPAIHHILQEAHHKLGILPFLDQVVSPLLLEVGYRWEKAQWDPFQESVCSTVIRDYLVGLRHEIQVPSDAPLILAACLPGEAHDLPLCILLLKARMMGYRGYLISSSPAPGSIEHLVRQFKPAVVLLSAMSLVPFQLCPGSLEEIDEFAHYNPHIRFFVGGIGAKSYLQTHNLQSVAFAEAIEPILEE
ncbi:MerR family transcriptional regulator [Lysinibacillus odysseyi]|nr:MerR family transcriptional regulator [Lysinibacillus odysseyi]